MPNRGVVILGAASSVARAIGAEFAARGTPLLLADYDTEEAENNARDLATRFGVQCEARHFDALAYDSHGRFAERAADFFGATPNGVVLCFGFMAEQDEAARDFTLAKRMLDTNLTGAVSVLERFAALLSARGQGGFICALSSVAGDRGKQSNYIYGASKAGLTCYLDGLRNRLHAAGVDVICVKPGFMDTAMTYGTPLPGPLVATPAQAGKAIHRAIERRRHTVYVRWFWRYIMLIIRAIPEWQFKKMKM